MGIITELQLRDDFDASVNLPGDDTIQTYRVTGAQIRTFLADHWEKSDGYLGNLGLSVSAAASAMTVALKQANGSSDPSSTDEKTKVKIVFRSPTLTSGAKVLVDFDAALSIVIPSTATMGFQNSDAVRVHIYAYYDGTNKGLMVSTQRLDESQVYSFVAIGTGSDSNGLYADAIRSGAAVRLIGEFGLTSITTAGTWTSPTYVATAMGCPRKRGLLRTVTITTPGANTYNKNEDADFVEVEIWGGGGQGGGTSADDYRSGAGGGPGAGAIKTILNSALADAETVTIGAGGTTGTTGNGQDGGTTSFGSHVTADGGNGGLGNINGGSNDGTAQKTTTSGADIAMSGGPGGNCASVSGHGVYWSGFGGSTRFGGGGRSQVGNSAAGIAATGYGSGGAGAVNAASTTARNGGAGADGICIVKEYKL